MLYASSKDNIKKALSGVSSYYSLDGYAYLHRYVFVLSVSIPSTDFLFLKFFSQFAKEVQANDQADIDFAEIKKQVEK